MRSVRKANRRKNVPLPAKVRAAFKRRPLLNVPELADALGYHPAARKLARAGVFTAENVQTYWGIAAPGELGAVQAIQQIPEKDAPAAQGRKLQITLEGGRHGTPRSKCRSTPCA
jgi:hypothetical protein